MCVEGGASKVANIITDTRNPTRNQDGTIRALHGTTRNPDHEWRIDLAPTGHCYLYVDNAFVIHGSIRDCTLYLSQL